MESVTIIFSMFRLVFVEILSYGVRYTLIINKMRVVQGVFQGAVNYFPDCAVHD